MPQTNLSRLCLGFAALATGLACSSTPPTPPPAPARIVLVTAPGGTGAIGLPLSPQPVLQVQDAAGNDVATRGLLVTAAVASGGGSLTGTTALRTDATGRVAFTDLAVTGPAGPRILSFQAQGLAGTTSGTITLSPGPVATAVPQAGNNQTVPAGTAVPTPPAVLVTDGSGNPVPGVAVTFAVATGGGALTGASAVTGANGIAAAGGWTLGTAVGLNTVTAAVAGLTPAVSFSATGVVGPAAQIAIEAGNGQSATIGNPVATAPAVKVTDAFGNPVAGLAVTFAVASGGGSLTTFAPVSNAQGVATVGSWQLGLVPGANTVTASRPGITPATFAATAVDRPVSAISAGAAHSCAATAADPRCWGDNTSGTLGNGLTTPDSVPALVSGGLTFVQMTAGTAHSCGLTAAGAAWCWGLNSSGQLGDGTGTSSLVPVAVTGGRIFSQLSAGAAHTCGVLVDGTAWCWGAGTNGRLGYGATLASAGPIAVSGGHLFSAVSAGGAHSCGLRTDGVVLCWGSNGSGRLGDGTTTDRLTPTATTGTWTAVSAGGSHTCAIDPAQAAWCWGSSTSGQGGTGAVVASLLTPTAVAGGLVFTAITAGTIHTCAIATDAAAHCWGSNASGRLGDGTTTQRNAPVAVLGGLRWTALSAGGQHTCGRSTAGSGLCWGRNLEGQLGDATTQFRPSPVGVIAP